MTVNELIDRLNNPDYSNLKVSFSVANARSTYHTNAKLEEIDIDEEDGRVFFYLKKIV